ncbi:MAG: menaquinone biosynthesis protein [Fibrobacteraceae bacterium]|nr:menaquinone biosynthesis protein [Fibrobacteraceae bacterium]
MVLRIGRIPFLVCAPFFHLFLQRERRFQDYYFEDGVPRALNKKLWSGEIHLAPASSIAYARAPQSLVLAPDICTSSKLEVHSVELFSRCPIEDLSKKRIFLSSQSATSVALLRILCSQRYHISPEFIINENTDFDAKLLIGDEALLEKMKMGFPYCYDLASLWREWQGLPFVFGAWSIHHSALFSDVRPLLEAFLTDVKESIKVFRESPERALASWSALYSNTFPKEFLLNYYGSLDYEFTEERKESLSLYFLLCKKEGILLDAPKLKFL